MQLGTLSFLHQKFDCRLLGKYIAQTFIANVHIYRLETKGHGFLSVTKKENENGLNHLT